MRSIGSAPGQFGGAILFVCAVAAARPALGQEIRLTCEEGTGWSVELGGGLSYPAGVRGTEDWTCTCVDGSRQCYLVGTASADMPVIAEGTSQSCEFVLVCLETSADLPCLYEDAREPGFCVPDCTPGGNPVRGCRDPGLCDPGLEAEELVPACYAHDWASRWGDVCPFSGADSACTSAADGDADVDADADTDSDSDSDEDEDEDGEVTDPGDVLVSGVTLSGGGLLSCACGAAGSQVGGGRARLAWWSLLFR